MLFEDLVELWRRNGFIQEREILQGDHLIKNWEVVVGPPFWAPSFSWGYSDETLWQIGVTGKGMLWLWVQGQRYDYACVDELMDGFRDHCPFLASFEK